MKLEGFIMEENYPSLVTPWAEGGTLNEFIKKHVGCYLVPIVWSIVLDSDPVVMLVNRQVE